MAGLNGINCLVSMGGNTGLGKCQYTLKHIIGDILVPKGYKIPASQFVTILNVLKTAAKADNRLNRVFPIYGYEQVDPANVERQTQTLGYGATFEVTPERKGMTYIIPEKECLNRQAANFRNMQDAYDRIAVAADGALIGTSKFMSDGEVALGGFALTQLYPSPYQEPDGSNVGQWTIGFQHTDIKEWDNRMVVMPQSGNVVTDVLGLKQVNLELVKVTPTPAVGIYHIKATESCGALNMAEIYGTELSSPGLWVVTNYSNGNAITVTSVAPSGAGNFILTLDDEDADFISATRIKVGWTTPTLLEAAGVIGYEADTCNFPK